MKKFVQEVVTYFWIPLIMALVSYIFFQLKDVLLGIITLVALSAVYTVIRLYFVHKKWWLIIILVVIVFGSVGYFFARAPAINLAINGQTATGSSVSLPAGSVTVNPAPGTTGKYTKGAVVSLTANPAPGYDWKSWTGTDNDAVNPTILTLNSDKHVTANFEPRYSLIINNQLVIGSFVSFTQGSVTINPAPGGDGKYTSGTAVTLTANPAPGYDWDKWLGTDKDNASPTTVTMNSNKNITVTIEPRFSFTIGNQLAISSSVNFNEGIVTLTPPPGPDDKYARGTTIMLTAVPTPGYGWKTWSGTSNDGSNPTTVTIASDKHIAVTFELRFFLTVNNQAVPAPGASLTGGTVTANPAPGADGRYANGSTVALTVTPAASYRFDKWSGDVSGNTTTISFIMNGGRSVTANFIKTYSLTTSVNTAAGGSVSPTSGIYDEGTNVTLTATPAAGYRFDKWSGDISGSTTTISAVMNAAKNVTATFVKVYKLTASASPATGGGISAASGPYDEGATVTLTAIPAAGYRFGSWGGDVSGNTTTVPVAMDADKNVTASFIRVYTLTTSASPAIGGSVSPAGGTYDEGTSVTLTAVPAAGYHFDRWSGDVSGTTGTISVTMNAGKNATAVFIKN